MTGQKKLRAVKTLVRVTLSDAMARAAESAQTRDGASCVGRLHKNFCLNGSEPQSPEAAFCRDFCWETPARAFLLLARCNQKGDISFAAACKQNAI